MALNSRAGHKIRKDRLAAASKTPVAAIPTATEVKRPTQLATPSDSSVPPIATPTIIKAPADTVVVAAEPTRPAQIATQPSKIDSSEALAKIPATGFYGKSERFEIELRPSGSSLDVVSLRDERELRTFRCGTFFSQLTVSQDKQIEKTSCTITAEPAKHNQGRTWKKGLFISGKLPTLIVQYLDDNNFLMETPEKITLVRIDLKPQFEQAAKTNPALTTEDFLQKTTTATK